MYTYMITNASCEGIFVEFERKKRTQHWCSYFQITSKY